MAIPMLRRFVPVTVLAVALLVASPASADATPPAACGAEVPLAGALVTVRRAAEGLSWDVRFILEVDASFDFRSGAIPFASPLLPGEVLRAAPGVEAIREGDRIVGLCVTREALHERTIAASFVEQASASVPAPASRGSVLGVPIARGRAVHVIDSAAGANVQVELSNGRFERHVGFVAPHFVQHAAREEARRLTGASASTGAIPVFVRGDDVPSEGLVGNVLDERARTRTSALGVGLIFASVVGALVFAAGRLRQKASIERADAILASEIDDAETRART